MRRFLTKEELKEFKKKELITLVLDLQEEIKSWQNENKENKNELDKAKKIINSYYKHSDFRTSYKYEKGLKTDEMAKEFIKNHKNKRKTKIHYIGE